MRWPESSTLQRTAVLPDPVVWDHQQTRRAARLATGWVLYPSAEEHDMAISAVITSCMGRRWLGRIWMPKCICQTGILELSLVTEGIKPAATTRCKGYVHRALLIDFWLALAADGMAGDIRTLLLLLPLLPACRASSLPFDCLRRTGWK